MLRVVALIVALNLALIHAQWGPGFGAPGDFGPPDDFGPPQGRHRHHHHHQFGGDFNGDGGGGNPQEAGFGRPNPGQDGGGGGLLGHLLQNPAVQSVAGQLMQGLGETINGISSSFFAPQPVENGIPPHVLRRAMRFCRRHPDHHRCREHPEWTTQGKLPDVGGAVGDSIDLGDVFPALANFHLPPVPRMALQNVLANVPQELISVLPAPFYARISEAVKTSLLKRCGNGKCKKQDPHALNLRASIAEREAALHRRLSPGLDQTRIDQDVEIRMARTHQLKQALLRKAGLDTQITAKDDGVFQNDILLTEEQANRLINQVNNAQMNEMAVPGGRGKRSAVYLEENNGRKWPTNQPILYMFDPQLSAAEQGHINRAIQNIQSKTCVRFQQVTARPNGNYIYYSKWTVGGFCGLSHIGMKSPAPNLVYLSFNCGNEPGIALHETLHALGLNHEQLRGDRDQFIDINWDNVDPQNYDFFAIADAKEFTSYGVKYNYGSVMHYNQFINTIRPGYPTMTARQNPQQNNALMGQRAAMRSGDIQLVQKMYCLPPTCVDENVYCGAWANRDLCPTSTWLQQHCKKSCNLCPGMG